MFDDILRQPGRVISDLELFYMLGHMHSPEPKELQTERALMAIERSLVKRDNRRTDRRSR